MDAILLLDEKGWINPKFIREKPGRESTFLLNAIFRERIFSGERYS